jgi:hypothetical protein
MDERELKQRPKRFESAYWLELLAEGAIVPAERTAPLHREANEIVSIMVASIRTLKDR